MKEDKKRHKAGGKSKHEKDDSSKSSNVREKPVKVKAPDLEPQRVSDLAEEEDEMPTDEMIIKSYPKTCHPIRSFVDDREELIEQLFLTVRTPELLKILPETLKTYKIEELKKMCLQQVQSMPRDLILHILAGKDMAQYVEARLGETLPQCTAASAEQGTEAQRNPLKRKTEDDEAIVSSTTETGSSAKRVTRAEPSGVAGQESLELFPSSTDADFMIKELVKDKENPHVVESIQEPVGELLELEMRARAIRSFLKAKGFSSSEEEDEGEDNEPCSGKD